MAAVSTPYSKAYELFTATEITLRGRRAFRLVQVQQTNTFLSNSPSNVINLIVEQKLSGYDRFPAAYEYLEDPPDFRMGQFQINATLRIVAAPGVSVFLEQFSFEPSSPHHRVTLLEIYRVQDPGLVPPIGASIASYGFTGTEEINPAPYIDLTGIQHRPYQYPEDYFKIDRRPSSLIINHPFSTFVLTLSVDQLTQTSGSSPDAKARFCYWFDPQGTLTSPDNPPLRIVKTPEVSASYSGGPPRVSLIPSSDFRNVHQSLTFWRVWEVDDINSVPPQGYKIDVPSGWREVSADRESAPIEETLALAAFDAVIGSIPVVGPLIDIAEFIYGLVESQDRWGRKLAVTDKVILGVGALIPLISLRFDAQRLVKLLGRRVEAAQTLIGGIKAAGLTSEELQLVRKVDEIIKRGGRPTGEMVEGFLKIARRVNGEYPSLELLLNADRTGFIHPELQEAFQRYVQDQGKNAADPTTWALRQTSGKPRQIFERLIGSDYARGARRVASQRYYNLREIVRPAGYTNAQVEALVNRALQNPEKTLERLGKLVEQIRSNDPAVSYLARQRLSAGLFRILKGNLAEVYSLETQMRILRKHPGAELFTDIRIRLMQTAVDKKTKSLSRALLFSDNIIAIRNGTDLELKVLFEVKAGYQGGQEATSQIFKWIEDRITDGSEIVIPAIINSNGEKEVLKTPLIFTYNPSKPGTPRITELLSAGRHIITASGVSHLGIESSEQVAAKVARDQLEIGSSGITSALLDYLVGQVVRRIFP